MFIKPKGGDVAMLKAMTDKAIEDKEKEKGKDLELFMKEKFDEIYRNFLERAKEEAKKGKSSVSINGEEYSPDQINIISQRFMHMGYHVDLDTEIVKEKNKYRTIINVLWS